jgi:hypothetical protein
MEHAKSKAFMPGAYVPIRRFGGSMTYWVKRIILKSGELVTERELRRDENFFEESPAPIVSDEITVTCRGRTFRARVIWGNWPGREATYAKGTVIPLRVEEI